MVLTTFNDSILGTPFTHSALVRLEGKDFISFTLHSHYHWNSGLIFLRKFSPLQTFHGVPVIFLIHVPRLIFLKHYSSLCIFSFKPLHVPSSQYACTHIFFFFLFKSNSSRIKKKKRQSEFLCGFATDQKLVTLPIYFTCLKFHFLFYI